MASVRNLKKDINFVIGDIIEAVYLYEMTSTGQPTQATNAIIEDAITTFDGLMKNVNNKKVENRKAHLKQVNKDLEVVANQLVEKINNL